MRKIRDLYTYYRYDIAARYRDAHSYLAKGILAITIFNLLLFLTIGMFIESENLSIIRMSISIVLLMVSSLNLLLHYRCKDVDQRNLLNFRKVSSIARMHKKQQIGKALFPLMYYTRAATQRDDASLWTFIICSYYQEKDRVLTKKTYVAILERLFADPIIDKAYQSDIGVEQRELPKGWKDLLASQMAPGNLIKWPIFYSWHKKSIWCAIPLIHQTDQHANDEEKAQMLYDRLKKADQQNIDPALTRAEIKFMDRWIETNKERRQAFFLLPPFVGNRDAVEEGNHYYQATIQARKIIKEVIDAETQPLSYDYQTVGATSRDTETLTNDAYPKQSVYSCD